MTAVIINQSDGGRPSVRFRYDASVVSTIKSTVPGHSRSWDAQRRVWHVDADWVAILAAELRRHGHVVSGVDRPPPRQVHTGDAAWAQSMFRRCGHQRVEPVFKALAKVLHPDTATGDTELMRELLDARNQLTEGAQAS